MTFGGSVGLDLVQPVFHVPGDFVAVLAHQHEAQAENHFALAVCRDGPSPNFMTNLHVGHVLYPDGHALFRRDHDVLDLLDVHGPAQAVDQEHLAVLADVAAADVSIVLFDGFDDFIERQTIFDEAGRVDPNLILLFVATPGVDLGGALHRPHFRLDDPIMDGAEFRDVVAFAGHDVMENFAQTCGNRPHLGVVDARWVDGRC